MMGYVFLNHCGADGCYKKCGKGKQMYTAHQAAYERGESFKAFYGKTVQKKGNYPYLVGYCIFKEAFALSEGFLWQ